MFCGEYDAFIGTFKRVPERGEKAEKARALHTGFGAKRREPMQPDAGAEALRGGNGDFRADVEPKMRN